VSADLLDDRKEHQRAAWLACWPIARTALLLVFRRKLFWLFLGIALLTFMFWFGVIYLLAELNTEQPGIGRMLSRLDPNLEGSGRTFLNFMFAQGTVTMILLAFAGSVLAGNDHLRGGLTFYLSRRINVLHYTGGKLLAIGLLVSLTTTLPAMVLFLEQGMLGDTAKYFSENYNIAIGILGYGGLIAVTLGLLLFALVSWMPRPVPLVMSWACMFVFLPVLSGILRWVFDDRHWRLLNLWRDLYAIGSRCFGEAVVRSSDEAQLPEAAAVVFSVCLISFIAIVVRIRQLRHQS
jgi:hypothetical protein